MSLNELLRDNNSNKWANLNVQSVTAVTENVTTVNATTVNSVQENTLREVIKAVDNNDHVIDMSKDLTTARVVSKVATTGALQPYEIQASNLLWRNTNPLDLNEIVLTGPQFNGAGSLGAVLSGRCKMVFATINASGIVIAQSGGITQVIKQTGIGPGVYDVRCWTGVGTDVNYSFLNGAFPLVQPSGLTNPALFNCDAIVSGAQVIGFRVSAFQAGGGAVDAPFTIFMIGYTA